MLSETTRLRASICPVVGHRCWPDAGYRRIFHRPWFHLFYRIDESQRLIEIARIWDVRQDPASFSL